MADPQMQLLNIPTPGGLVPFHIPREMDAATARCIGTGSFGTVISVQDGGIQNVVKKFKRPFESRDSALRVLREIFYLKELSPFNNRHVIRYHGIYTSAADSQSLDDLYLVTDHCDTDLRKLLSDSVLPIEHIRHMSHTIASGIKFIHSAGILHRDLKPENIGVNRNGSTKIFDFGLSCGLHRGILNTRYVQTRYYRAPEVVCMSSYSEPSDWWSFGCILVEFFTASPLFPGQNHIDQIVVIAERLGPFPPAFIALLEDNTRARQFAQDKTGHIQHGSLELLLRTHVRDEQAMDLVKSILAYVPEERADADAILDHPFYASIPREPEVRASRRIDLGDESVKTLEGIRKEFWEEAV